MKKAEIIKRYGEEAYEKLLERQRAYYKANKEEDNARSKRSSQEQNRKGGKYYDKQLEKDQIGLRRSRHLIRKRHQNQYRPYKDIIAPESQIHHEWIPNTSEYTGMALVEADQHMHGFVDVIEILDGTITLLLEDEIKKRGERNDEN